MHDILASQMKISGECSMSATGAYMFIADDARLACIHILTKGDSLPVDGNGLMRGLQIYGDCSYFSFYLSPVWARVF